jgi:AbiU2
MAETLGRVMSEIPFETTRDAVDNEVVLATNAYLLLTDLAVPLAKQPLLYEHYPFLVGNLLDALAGQVLMTVCRLFDPDNDPRHASLSNFLRSVVSHHGGPTAAPPKLAARRVKYEEAIPDSLAAIATRWKILVRHRSAYLAHRDLSKMALREMTYSEVRECLDLAQEVVAGYFSAYEDTTRLFHIDGFEHDPPRFLKWCRLDDYERHFNEDMARQEKKRRGEDHL